MCDCTAKCWSCRRQHRLPLDVEQVRKLGLNQVWLCMQCDRVDGAASARAWILESGVENAAGDVHEHVQRPELAVAAIPAPGTLRGSIPAHPPTPRINTTHPHHASPHLVDGLLAGLQSGRPARRDLQHVRAGQG